MKKSKQTTFDFQKKLSAKSSFGGSSLTSHPKTARPISTKDLMHVVLKSEQAKGPLSFSRHERELVALPRSLAARFHIKVMDVVVMGNHVHLALRTRSRRAFQSFLRSLSGLVARLVLGAQRETPSQIKDFFTGRPFSRIVNGAQRSFRALCDHFELNRLEKRGIPKEVSRHYGLVECQPASIPI